MEGGAYGGRRGLRRVEEGIKGFVESFALGIAVGL